ncbi:radical SAM protein [bacterium]|nr:MAG: radical SAM protein [bacterium]
MALHLRVSGACNLDCVFCSYPDRTRAFSLPALLREAKASRERLVQVSGGEPLAAPRTGLLALLTWLRRRGRLVELQTNGTLAAQLPERFLTRLGALVDVFNVNFSAASAARDRALTGLRGAFAAREAGVRRLCALGPPVRLTYVVCAENLAETAAFPDYVARRLPGVSWLQFSFVKGQGRPAERPALVPRYEDAVPAFLRALRACARLGLRAQVDHIPPCYLPGFEGLHADADKVRRGVLGPHAREKARTPECRGCALPCPGPRLDRARG